MKDLYNFYFLNPDYTSENYTDIAWYHLEPCDEYGMDKMPQSDKWIRLYAAPEPLDDWWKFLDVVYFKPFIQDLYYIFRLSPDPVKSISRLLMFYLYTPPNEFVEFQKNISLGKVDKTEDVVKTYLMKDSNTGLYKIGKSVKPKRREKTLQSEKPTIKMVKIWNKDIEKKLHRLYSKHRVRGEWFKLTAIQVRYICTHF